MSPEVYISVHARQFMTSHMLYVHAIASDIDLVSDIRDGLG